MTIQETQAVLIRGSRLRLAVGFLFGLVTSMMAFNGSQAQPLEGEDDQIGAMTAALLFGPRETDLQAEILLKLVLRNKPDVVPALTLVMRYRDNSKNIRQTLSLLTGTEIETWRDAMLWQEAHPEVVPHPSFRDIKLQLLARIDPNFLRFLKPPRSDRARMRIRLEEIVWGGVGVDGIPSLDNPKLIAAADADYLLDDDLVFGVEINGDARAYPLRIMGWHEMFNDVIGGVPVALAYCTLCGAGILYETQIPGRARPFVFGSSGFLYRSNKLMFDRESDSLWNQFTGRPVVGPLAESGLELRLRPVTITSWEQWRARKPDTRVLSLRTGYHRDYGSGVVYREYFESPDLMFPAIVGDESVVRRKDYVFGVRTVAAARAWPLAAFADEPVINDAVGGQNLVLIGDPATRTVRAYRRDEQRFEKIDEARLRAADGIWTVTEDALLGPSEQRLARMPGHVSYWFAWDGYLGVDSSLYGKGS